MKKFTSVDVIGSFILLTVILTVIGLFFFAGNGQFIAKF